MSLFPLVLQRLITSFLVVVLLALGVMDPILALPQVPDQCASEQCIGAPQLIHHVSFDGLHDAGDQVSDLEQLLQHPSDLHLPILNSGPAVVYLAAYWPRRTVPPILRPPSFVG